MKVYSKITQLPNFQPILLLLLGVIFYFPFLGAVHLFDWDEINFAEAAREMLTTGKYFQVNINYQPFWEKPPLFFWFQAFAMQCFGINELAARLPNALFGIASLFMLYLIGKKQHNARFGFLWAIIFGSSLLPFLYFKSSIIDPVFNFFIFLSVYFLQLSVATKGGKNSSKYAFLGGLINGLAVLTKGPVGFLIVVLSFISIWIYSKLKSILSIKDVLLFGLGVLLSSSIWYLPEVFNHGLWFFVEFIKYQIELFSEPVAGHQQPFFYHFVVVFIGCFPMSAYAIPVLIKKNYPFKSDFRQWMVVLFWVVLILFSIVKTKIVHYSSMTYLPLSYLAAINIQHYWDEEKRLPRYAIYIILSIGTILGLLLLLLPFVIQFKSYLYPFIKDPFAVDSLKTNVTLEGWEFLLPTLFLVAFWWSCRQLFKGNFRLAIWLNSVILTTFLLLYLKIIVPKIEAHSQAPAIEFYESLQGKNIYVDTYGFKSYAQLFYFRKPLLDSASLRKSNDTHWLLHEKTDKDVYLVTKSTEMGLDTLPQFRLIRQKGGFKLYYKKATLSR